MPATKQALASKAVLMAASNDPPLPGSWRFYRLASCRHQVASNLGGRQVAVQLASLGVRQLQVIDFDVVDLTNVTTQGYLPEQIGQPKVNALRQTIAQIDPSIAVDGLNDRYRPKQAVHDAVFCCVDAISARQAIWRAVGPHCRF